MTKMYTAEVVADSISPEGHRITSVKVIYPHAVHKDMLRHRVHNRNVESFRAQPPENLIKNLRNGGAFKPDVFAQRVKGMGQSHEEIIEADAASTIWDQHVLDTVSRAEYFLNLGVAKQQVNFLLQDLCPLTEIITATDWENFFALRRELNDDGTPVARPEVFKTADAIYSAIQNSAPRELSPYEIHLPFVSDDEMRTNSEPFWVCVSAGRCARISFGDYDWRNEDPAKGFERSNRLLKSGHMSPFEQQAKPFSRERWDYVNAAQNAAFNYGLPQLEVEEICRQLEYSGNLHGWVPYRKSIPFEWDYSLIKAASMAG